MHDRRADAPNRRAASSGWQVGRDDARDMTVTSAPDGSSATSNGAGALRRRRNRGLPGSLPDVALGKCLGAEPKRAWVVPGCQPLGSDTLS
jgi:hypothetical protein